MKNLIGILTIFMLTITANNLTYGETVGPEWIQRYNGAGNSNDVANSVALDKAGNVYVTGYSYDNVSGYDYTTMKYDFNGDSLWVRRYNGPGNNDDQAISLAVDSLGNVYVTGFSTGIGTNVDFATIKYNTDGDLLWIKRFSGTSYSSPIREQPVALTIDRSGNVYVTGYSWGFYYDYVTIKYNTNGDSIWTKAYTGPHSNDVPTAIAVDDLGNVYVTGYSHGGSSYEDYATIKYSSNGDTLWVSRYNGDYSATDVATSIAVDASGNVYVTGYIHGIGTSNDYATIKYDSNGDSVWVRRYNGFANNNDNASSLAVDDSGNVFVTGRSTDYANGYNYWGEFSATIKYNSAGVRQWVKNYPLVNSSYPILKLDRTGNVYVTGFNSDYATIKYNPITGDTLWVQIYNGPTDYYTGNLQDIPTSIAIDTSGNVYVTGASKEFYNYASYDYATIKYSTVPRKLQLKVLIEGFYDDVTNKLIEDTVRIYLRNSMSPYQIVDLATTVLDTGGNATLKFFNASNFFTYYIVVRHRNSIETWSSTGKSFLLSNLSYNFIEDTSVAYGNNLILKGTKHCIYSGDINQDGNVDLADLSLAENAALNFLFGYVSPDITGEEFVDITDCSIVDNNSFNYVSVVRP